MKNEQVKTFMHGTPLSLNMDAVREDTKRIAKENEKEYLTYLAQELRVLDSNTGALGALAELDFNLSEQLLNHFHIIAVAFDNAISTFEEASKEKVLK